MVANRLNLEPEVQEIFKHIDAGQNFLLSGGAGSGKTYSMIQLIQQIIVEKPTTKVICITYTNAAVKEIESRINNKNLTVSTIHDFLWDNIKSYQKELKTSLAELIKLKKIESLDGEVHHDYFLKKNIQYKEYTLIRDGIISHDELPILANHMFKSYQKLCDILKDKFKFIFIDEYQDTNRLVIEIVLNFIARSVRSNVVGFFGDAMQSIYDGSVGDLEKYISENLVQEVKKEQNRRNPRLVYELANKLRTDGIKQRHANDCKAPNMENGSVKEGSIKFYYSTGTEKLKLEYLKQSLRWDTSNTKQTRELNLTHKLIAHQARFGTLMNIYSDDKILEYNKIIIKYIEQHNITLDFSNLTFGDVIEEFKQKVSPTKKQEEFIKENPSLYEKAKSYRFEEFRKIHVNKDSLIDDKKEDEQDSGKPRSKRDDLIKHLFKIQRNVILYRDGKYNEFLRKTEFQIKSVASKIELKEIISHLQEMSSSTIDEVIEYAHEKGICIKDDKLAGFIKNKRYVYDRIKQVQFKEFQNLFNYLEGYTAFSTQHKIKGTEFDNVLVILDNGGWRDYNFQRLFEDDKKQDGVRKRTLNLFYVCCTRAKENLVVYYPNPTERAIEQAEMWFGKDNVARIESNSDSTAS